MSRTIIHSPSRALACSALCLALLGPGTASAGDYFDERVIGQALSSTLPAAWQRAPATAPTASPLLDAAALAYAWAPPLPGVWKQATAATGACPALLKHSFNLLQSSEAQYEGLEALYRKYRDRGLVVVGFPSNDFGSQEPGTNKEIAEFCRTTYGVQFPLYEKTTVANLASNTLYAQLAKATGQKPKWNFHKYVVDRDGNAIASFGSDVKPDARELIAVIERSLAQKPAPAKG